MVFKKNIKFLKNKKTNDYFSSITKQTKYNILLVVDKILDNDVGREITDFANYLVCNNVGVVLLTGKERIKLFIKDSILLIENGFFFENSVILFHKIVSLCKKYNIDIIQFYNIELCNVILKVKHHLCLPSISVIFDMFDLSNRLKAIQSRNIFDNELVITMSENVVSFMLNNFDFDFNKIRFFPICVDSELFNVDKIASGRVKSVLNNDVKCDVNKQIIYCIVDFCNVKTCITILKAIKLIGKSDIIFVLSGLFEGNREAINILIRKIKELNISNVVKLIKPISDKPAMYLSCYAVINVSNKNNCFSRSFCEAGFMKKPIIELCSNRECKNVIDEKTGLIVDSDNLFEIKTAITKILNLTQREYHNMCENAYEYISKYFDKKKIYKEIEENIAECLEKHRKKFIKNSNKKSLLSDN